jgi:hypothetical protein
MTLTEVLSEIQKLPPIQKRQILLELTEQLEQAESTDLNAKEKKICHGFEAERFSHGTTASLAR